MDWPLIEHKLESLRRCVHRIEAKCPASADTLAKDADAQDIIALNLTRAVQLCVDIAAHLVSTTDLPPPASMGEAFDRLCQADMLTAELSDRLKRSVGFRNLAVHNYREIDWAVVFSIATLHLEDFRGFAQAVLTLKHE